MTNINNKDIEVKGCGCRYRIHSTSFNPYEVCDHLCDKHKDEFILQQYNHNRKIEQRMDEDIKIWKKMIDRRLGIM